MLTQAGVRMKGTLTVFNLLTYKWLEKFFRKYIIEQDFVTSPMPLPLQWTPDSPPQQPNCH